MKENQKSIKEFQTEILRNYTNHGRVLPWRTDTSAYSIFVSEVMLQQTQVGRVETKYHEFLRAFPDFTSLSRASLSEIYAVWQGMGYNRRAKYLKDAACLIETQYKGKLPQNVESLDALPGIGHATASSIAAFAFNLPTVFIETNIRSVFIHFFFPKQEKVSDAQIVPLVKKTLDTINPRQWYWALMDYGAMLKKTNPNPSRQSRHYQKQSTFEGSNRQLRGKILKLLSQHARLSHEDLKSLGEKGENRIDSIVKDLISEGLIKKTKGKISFA